MNLHTSRILFQKDSSYKSQFCTEVHALSRLVSDFWAKYKDAPTKILKCHAKTTQIKDLRMNSTDKLAKKR